MAKIFDKNPTKTPQKSFMKRKTKTLSELCDEQKPFYVQKFDTTSEEKERIIKQVVKEHTDHVNKLLANIKIVRIKTPTSKFWSIIKRFFTKL